MGICISYLLIDCYLFGRSHMDIRLARPQELHLC
jgi:hypothetical protein